jgi:hypothetical protein
MLTAQDRIENRVYFADSEFQKGVQLVGIALLTREVSFEFFLPIG